MHYNDFRQEGHRLEFKEWNDPSSALEFKGVVYNEMKGAMSAPDQIMVRSIQKELYPSTTYHYNSGGAMDNIVQLVATDPELACMTLFKKGKCFEGICHVNQISLPL